MTATILRANAASLPLAELARALQVDKPAVQVDGQGSLLDLIDGGAA